MRTINAFSYKTGAHAVQNVCVYAVRNCEQMREITELQSLHKAERDVKQEPASALRTNFMF